MSVKWPREIWLTNVNGVLAVHTSVVDALRHVEPWDDQEVLRVEVKQPVTPTYVPEVISPEVARLTNGGCG